MNGLRHFQSAHGVKIGRIYDLKHTLISLETKKYLINMSLASSPKTKLRVVATRIKPTIC